MTGFFVTFEYLWILKNSYKYFVLPQKMPHKISVWQMCGKNL